MWQKTILVIASLVSSGSAYACSCALPLDLEEAEASAEYVFVGRLVSKNPLLSLRANKYKFDVEHAYKGAPDTKVSVWSPKRSMSCGIDVDRRSQYVVFVYKNSGEEKLYVGRCSTWPINEYWDGWTEEFRKIHPDEQD